MIDEGPKQRVVGGLIMAKCCGRLVKGAVQERCASVFQGMGERDFRMDPRKAFGTQVEFLKNGGGDGGGMDG
jgi:hypothetical protein